ncbi:MAG: undecaprenyl-diphosphate phosphatase, partial [Hyphomonadaceae bacterium]|nr:undecaprenyl-diphosphate phosphatase [Clostridia bacterium]
MDYLIAVVLGIVQGVGEFLPISSSANLILARWFFGWDMIMGNEQFLTLDVALHLGTLTAVLAFFYKDWIRLTIDGVTKGTKTQEGKMFWYLVIGTIPGALAGLLLESRMDELFRSQYLLMAAALVIMGIVLYIVDKRTKQATSYENIGFKQAMWIGVMQTLALIPGVSRSGITMTTGRFLGLKREAAAKFSFMLSTPIIFAAAIKEYKEIFANITNPIFV